jgi:hypothetical protein
MTRSCAGRDRLVAVGAGKVEGNSRLRGAGQTSGCKTLGYKNCRGGGDFEDAPALRESGGGAGNSRARYWGNALLHTLPSARAAGDYQHDLASRTGKMIG